MPLLQHTAEVALHLSSMSAETSEMICKACTTTPLLTAFGRLLPSNATWLTTPTTEKPGKAVPICNSSQMLVEIGMLKCSIALL